MSKANQTPEAKILGWFKTAPLATARLILGLAHTEVAVRTERGEKHKGPKRKVGKPTAVAHPAEARGSLPAKPKAKKSHHKKKPATPVAQVEDFTHVSGN